MQMKKRLPTKRKRSSSLISSHLSGIKRALLEGEKRPAFLAFLDSELPAKHGIYALYDKNGRLYYSGKASDLPKRLNQHLKDRHGNSWETMTLFLVAKTGNVAQLEGLVVAAANPPGNKQKPKIGNDLRQSLRKYLRDDAIRQVDDAVYPTSKRVQREDSLTGRLTTKKLRELGQAKLARALGISQPRVSQLMNSGKIRQYILEAGKRDSVLLEFQKAKK